MSLLCFQFVKSDLIFESHLELNIRHPSSKVYLVLLNGNITNFLLPSVPLAEQQQDKLKMGKELPFKRDKMFSTQNLLCLCRVQRWCVDKSSKGWSLETTSFPVQPSSLQEPYYLSFITQKTASDLREPCVEPIWQCESWLSCYYWLSRNEDVCPEGVWPWLGIVLHRPNLLLAVCLNETKGGRASDNERTWHHT